MYLLDTNVVSELRRTKPHGAVLAWIQSVDDADLNISAVTLGELQAGARARSTEFLRLKMLGRGSQTYRGPIHSESPNFDIPRVASRLLLT